MMNKKLILVILFIFSYNYFLGQGVSNLSSRIAYNETNKVTVEVQIVNADYFNDSIQLSISPTDFVPFSQSQSIKQKLSGGKARLTFDANGFVHLAIPSLRPILSWTFYSHCWRSRETAFE
jgi:hypothetical protein